MGDVNQLEWVRRHIDRVRPPILEIGSKNYGAVSMDYRTLLAGRGQFVGTDMEAGDGGDVVADLTADFENLPEPLRATKFRTILCMSVMEHVRDVYKFAANVRRLLADDGVAFISVPWVWRFHGYPSDYWRFSPEALKFLFEPLVLDAAGSCLSYQQPGQIGPLSTTVLNSYPDYEADTAPASRFGRAVAGLYRGVTRLAPRLAGTRRPVLYPTMVNAVFQKAA
jgi:SAM-dependent methyltransferase